jgi:hypothetical protein
VQQLDGDVVGRADEGHAAVAGRAVDGDAGLLQAVAEGVDVVHLERQVAEVAALAVGLRVPVVGQLQQRSLLGAGAATVLRCRQEDQGIAPGLAVHAANLAHAELVAVEVDALVDVADTNHGVEIAHACLLLVPIADL